MTSRAVVRLGGLSLVLGAVAFMAVFSYLAARFHYPDVLDGPAATVLPALLETGTSGRAAWAFYAFLPLIWIPVGVGAMEALGTRRGGTMRMSLCFAILATISMMLGLMRWPTIHWRLAEAYGGAGAPEQAVIASIFDGLNTYLGNYIGEFLGELSFSLFFLLTSITWLAESVRPRWIGWFGVVTGVSGLVSMLRNMTTAVAPVAALNNYLLPLFMIALGVGLFRLAPRDTASNQANAPSGR